MQLNNLVEKQGEYNMYVQLAAGLPYTFLALLLF